MNDHDQSYSTLTLIAVQRYIFYMMGNMDSQPRKLISCLEEKEITVTDSPEMIGRSEGATPRYVVVTPARNEERFISGAIESVLNQTVLPLKHVIVSDGSNDSTVSIVESYATKHSILKLIAVQKEDSSGFGSKALAFNAGWKSLRDFDFDFLGNLDADVSLPKDYYERMIDAFATDLQLGLASGWIHDTVAGRSVPHMISDDSAGGPAQIFRRECLEQIGGYLPLKQGGIDAAAEILARMHGWRTMTIRDVIVHIRRPIRTGSGNVFGTRFNKGMMNYLLGYHPLFHLGVCFRRLGDRPWFIGSACLLAGYLSAAMKKPKRQVPPEMVDFLRKEQLHKLRNLFFR